MDIKQAGYSPVCKV